jgi:beta-glucanase (GH16 family)
MIKILKTILILCILQTEIIAQQCYTLVWSDEFDTDGAPNSANWGYDLGASGWGNNEVQNYTNSLDNARVENGILTIEAKKTGTQWSSARLISAGKRTFTYGRIEFRAKLPVGSGTWPALWMLGSNIQSTPWPACGEIDIMEHVGKNHGQVHSSLHSSSSYGATVNTGITSVQNVSTDFHIYRLDWTADSMKFFVDGNLFYTYAPQTKNDQNWPFNKPFFIIMNIAMGGNWGSDPQYETNGLKNGIDPALTSAKMEIDYVRVYQSATKPAISGDKVVNVSDTTNFSVPYTEGFSYSWGIPVDAQIISGINSNEISVKWGINSGNVTLAINSTCQTVLRDTLLVRARETPDTSEFHFPFLNEASGIIWEEVPSPGNSFSLTYLAELNINYQITQPYNNPEIKYALKNIFNFSRYKYLVVKLKTEKSNPPSILRIDLKDINNNVNLDKIFKITNFASTDTFTTYASQIESNASFDLSNISEINLYINYGLFGRSGSGNIQISDIFLADKFEVSIPKIENNDFTIYPNPASNFFTIKRKQNTTFKLLIIDNFGKIIYETENISRPVNIEHLAKGIYTVVIVVNYDKKQAFKLIKI